MNRDNRSEIRLLGAGLRAALATLGEPGRTLAARWAALSGIGALYEELECVNALVPVPARFDERRVGTRWRTYGRTGAACALLRRAGRCARRRDAEFRGT